MRRIVEDPAQPQALRDELKRSRAAARDYPVELELARLQAALADASRQPETGQGFAARTLHPVWKLAVVAAVSGGVIGWLAWPAAPVQRSFVPAQAKLEPPPPAEPTRIAPPTAADPAPAPAADPPAPVAPAQGPTAADAPAQSSRREIAQLIRIRSLLKRDPAAAQRLAERSEREFPDGLLSEERRALSIVALAKMGARQSAAAKAREFLARYPLSPMRGLIEAALSREAR